MRVVQRTSTCAPVIRWGAAGLCGLVLVALGSRAVAQTEVTPPASGVAASTHDGNVPGNSVDNNLSSRWSANGDGQWIRYDLGSARTLSHVAIAFYNGNTRTTRFDLQLSSDGSAWTNVLTNASSGGSTTQEQTFDFADQAARYVRYVGHGNSVNLWNSLLEVSLFAVDTPGATPTPTPTSTPNARPTPTPSESRPPGQNFDLSRFNLQTPLSSGGGFVTIRPPALSTYTSSIFYTGPDGAMTFWCPVNGATTGGTSYPRSELRDHAEWSITGTHTLTARCRVLQQPSNGNTIIGQVHGHVGGSELCKLRYSNGRVEAGVKPQLGGSETRRFITNVAVGSMIDYSIRVSNRVLTVTVNGTSVTHSLNSSWNADTYYFKAGTYPQDNSGGSSEGSRVAFYSLSRN
jgi:poly(beta-D-mannuronate) lyase